MKRFLIFIMMISFSGIGNGYGQKVAQKTNLAGWITTTPNFSVEFSLNRKLSLDAAISYNPWDFDRGATLNHWLVRPELRFWFCRRFEGHFMGIHALYGQYEIGRVSFIPALKDRIYSGNLYGGGLSYGYHFPLKGRWGLELTIGAGLVLLNYDRYRCWDCLERDGSYRLKYLGPTHAGITLVYMLK